jgi:hypothetical protein
MHFSIRKMHIILSLIMTTLRELGIIKYVKTRIDSGCGKAQVGQHRCNGPTLLSFETTPHAQQTVDQTGDFLRTIKNIL